MPEEGREGETPVPNLRKFDEVVEEVLISLPLAVSLSRKRTVDKRFILNLNNYRNAHYHILDDAKKAYVGEVLAALATAGLRIGTRVDAPVEMSYTLYPSTNRLHDVGNVLSIVQKFTEDALVHLKVLPDDNRETITRVVFSSGPVDRTRPRVEVVVRSAATNPQAAA